MTYNVFGGTLNLTQLCANVTLVRLSTRAFRYETEPWLPLFIAVMDEVTLAASYWPIYGSLVIDVFTESTALCFC